MNSIKLAVALLSTALPAICQTSFWTDSSLPGTLAANDASSVTLGLKFSSDVAGSVTGLRFYKGTGNGGTHVANLWTSGGTKLAEVVVSAESASGWQKAFFSSPVSITANTTYVISYFAPRGFYANDQYYKWSTLSATPLHVSGSSPGVYTYGAAPAFPNSAWNSSNYWVDPIFVAAASQPTSSTNNSFWPNLTNPGTKEVLNDSAAVTLGLKFYSEVSGSVTGVRFYKGVGNTGIHVGNLWSATGAKLAEITFASETASGWQQANFSTPVAITPNTTYTVSYFAPGGHYANDQNYPWSSLSATPLHVATGAPGVYGYSTSRSFPAASWNASNYWVDVVFAPGSATPPATSYTISGVVSGSAATVTLSGAATKSTTTGANGAYSFSGLPNGSYTITAGQSGYAFTPAKASVTVNGNSVSSVNFTSTAVSVSHSVTLSWSASTSANIVGYNVYRGSTSGGPFTQIAYVGGTSYVDSGVSAGQTYFYTATAVDSTSQQSPYATQAVAVIPTP